MRFSIAETYSILLNIASPVFAVSSMHYVSFRYAARRTLGPLRDIPGVITSAITNFVL
jgi:hypothetical protein